MDEIPADHQETDSPEVAGDVALPTTAPHGDHERPDLAETSFDVQQHAWVPAELADHPRYEILQLLGSGGMGVVYKARHRLMDRFVALKVIHPRLVDRPGMVRRFHREVQTAARLAHPNIVAAYDAEQRGETHFLVMEFVAGTDLEQVASARGQLPVTVACDYVRQAAFGLQHAFEKGMVHRDIKPHNLMLTPGGQVKILDFGLARFVSELMPPLTSAGADAASAKTASGGAMGTVDYMAPEEARDAHRADIRADIYSLGCTLYRFLAGRVPFPGGSWQQKASAHFHRQPKPLAELRSDVPTGLPAIIDRMLAKDPRQRYQTPAEVAHALAAYPAPSTHLVLVVDSRPNIRQAMRGALEHHGCLVTLADNGGQALEHLRSGLRPELILLGLAATNSDGWQLLRALRWDADLATIPTVFVASPHEAEAAELARAAAQTICHCARAWEPAAQAKE